MPDTITSNISYDDNSIEKLDGAMRVRFRPEALLGSKGIDGARHTIYEIVGNATDEKLAGYGEELDISLHEDGSVSVRDYGRGVPLGWNEKLNDWNYYLIYEELYAGGKYNDYQDLLKGITDWNSFKVTDVPYLFKIGLNGLGAAATQYTSEYCIVESYRDGTMRRMDYKNGAHILDELIEEKTDKPNGTYVHWKPDSKVFMDVDIGAKWLERFCKSLSFVSGFTVRFWNKGKMHEFPKSDIYKEMRESTGICIDSHNFTHTTDKTGDVCICFADIAIGKGGRSNEYYNNSIEVRGGVHADGVVSAAQNFIQGVMKSYSLKANASDMAGKFSFIVSTLSNKVSYRGQTKDSLDDYYIYQCIFEAIYKTLKTEYEKGSAWIMDIVESIKRNVENRMAVEELSKNIKDIEKASKKGKVSEKFRTCELYGVKPDQVEFWIMEGDSAGGSFGEARDPRYQCYLTIKGKSLNVYKATMDRLIANSEIKDIISALGCGVDLGIEGYESFNMSKLRVGKVIFGADADSDGKHIYILLLLIFLKLFPELLYEGRVYIAKTPLYAIRKLDDSFVYCMSEEERNAKIEELGGRGAIKEVKRFKGLGEVNADQLWETTVNPQTRHLLQIKIDRDDPDIYSVIECLFGKSVDQRRKVILDSMLGLGYDDIQSSIDDTVEYINGLGLSNVAYTDVDIVN